MKNIQNLTPEQKLNLFKKLKKRSEAKPESKGTSFIRSTSYLQDQMWYLHTLNKTSSAYLIPVQVKVEGNLDTQDLEKAIQKTLNRHPLLKSHFFKKATHVICKNADKSDIKIPIINYASENASKLKQYISKLSYESFDLENDIPIRFSILKETDTLHHLIIVAHHIVTDGWSLNLIIEDIFKFYSDRTLPVTQPTSYTNHIRHQDLFIKSEKGKKSLNFWVDKLRKNKAILDLPTDFTRPKHQTFEGDLHSFPIPEHIPKKIKELETSLKISPMILFLCAYATFIYKSTGSKEVVIGCPVANRVKKEFESTVGLFVNTLAIPISLEPKTSIRETLLNIHRHFISCLSNQEVPLEHILKEVNPSRDPSRNPFFQTSLAFQNFKLPEFKNKEIHARSHHLNRKASILDLSLEIFPEGSAYSAYFEFNTHLFKKTTIKRFSEQFVEVLKNICNNLDLEVSEIDILSESNKNKILSTYCIGKEVDIKTKLKESILNSFNKNKAKTAIVCEKKSISYDQLDNQSNKVANYIKNNNIIPGNNIGIITSRSIELGVAIMGALKADVCFVPISPDHPKERINKVLKDCKINLIITNIKDIQDQHPEYICVLISELLKTPLSNSIQTGDSSDSLPLYIIHTSGSTGNPKGALIERKSIANLSLWILDNIYTSQHKNIAVLAPFNFDPFYQQFFPAIISGKTLHISSEEERKDGKKLVSFLNNHKIDITDGTPNHLKIITLNPEAREASIHTKTFIIGGESLQPETLSSFKALFSHHFPTIYNAYGLTECGIDSSFHKIELKKPITDTQLPIGKPIYNTNIYVLNENKQILPENTKGIIFISGVGLSPGYVNDSQNTSFSKDIIEPEKALFNTGDIGELKNGSIYFHGRKDSQTKINGYRVDLKEIALEAQKIEGIQEAIALKKTIADTSTLVLFILGKTRPNVVKEQLSLKLPKYLIPKQIVKVNQFPLLSNGKVDTATLLKSAEKQSVTQEAETHLHKTIKKAWQQTLQLETISINDDFFEIGGNSILLLHLNTHINAALKEDLETQTLLEHTTINSLATYLSNSKNNESLQVSTLHKSNSKKAIFFIHALFSNTSVYHNFKGSLNKDISAYVINPSQKKFQKLEELTHSYSELIQKMGSYTDITIAGWSFGGILAYEISKVLLQKGITVSLIMIDTWAPTENSKQYLKKINKNELAKWLLFNINKKIPQDVCFGSKQNFSEITEIIRDSLDSKSTLSRETIHSEVNTAEYHLNLIKDYKLEKSEIRTLLITTTEQLDDTNIQQFINSTNQNYGWDAFITKNLIIHNSKGNHYSMLNKSNILKLSPILLDFINKEV